MLCTKCELRKNLLCRKCMHSLHLLFERNRREREIEKKSAPKENKDENVGATNLMCMAGFTGFFSLSSAYVC